MSEALIRRVETTPNPEAMKFTLSRTVTDGRPETYSSPDQALLSPLARALFAVPGVTGVFLLKDFITIRRAAGADWQPIVRGVETAIGDFYAGRD